MCVIAHVVCIIRPEQVCEFPNKFYFFSFVKKSRCIHVGTHSCQSSDDEAMPARHFSRGNPGVIEYLRDFVRTTSLPRGDKKKKSLLGASSHACSRRIINLVFVITNTEIVLGSLHYRKVAVRCLKLPHTLEAQSCCTNSSAYLWYVDTTVSSSTATGEKSVVPLASRREIR